ncbi:hypothetical protein OG453_07085 [Streptomyces sp. NBC_01381]|uniref:hypothetical protein n=1 Tax=Streptomyces sp. NBC_01381 TaxID=2903845 RepID=UPI002254F6FA|nr:hypothetical protein [Streptomyces sp. NBC_01381]MCX4666432.1 hypothetical protein [Streptomyces sp. NBC_01381]
MSDGVGDHLASQQLQIALGLIIEWRAQFLSDRDNPSPRGWHCLHAPCDRESVRQILELAAHHDGNLT